MSDLLTLSAETREGVGKGASRALRRESRVPAVIYGGKEEPQAIHLDAKELGKALSSGHFMNAIAMIEVDGKTIRTLPKDVGFHPVSDRALHVDFLRLSKDATVNVAVPVSFINEDDSPGLKRGGVLNIVRHELELICDAAKIPDAIEIELDGLEVGDSIHISAVKLPEGSTSAIDDRDFTIATVVAPSALKRADGEEDDAAEGEETAEGEEAAAEGESDGGSED